MITLPDIHPAGRYDGYGVPFPASTPYGLGGVCWGNYEQGEMNYRYRLWLWRGWAHGPCIHWVMLNPSTADALVVDPTIRRCMDYSKLWGFGQMYVSNLWSLRSTDPKALYAQPDPRFLAAHEHIARQQRLNDNAIRALHKICDQTIVAWGNHGKLYDRGKSVLHMIGNDRDRLVKHLGFTKLGEPKHPLYLHRLVAPRYLHDT